LLRRRGARRQRALHRRDRPERGRQPLHRPLPPVVRHALVIALLGLALAGSATGATGPPPYGIVSSATGAGLYAANCASCHGPRGEGIQPPGRPGAGDIKGAGPSLTDAGELGADFYLSTGYMPLRDPHAQPARSQVLFSRRELERLVRFVGAL